MMQVTLNIVATNSNIITITASNFSENAQFPLYVLYLEQNSNRVNLTMASPTTTIRTNGATTSNALVMYQGTDGIFPLFSLRNTTMPYILHFYGTGQDKRLGGNLSMRQGQGVTMLIDTTAANLKTHKDIITDNIAGLIYNDTVAVLTDDVFPIPSNYTNYDYDDYIGYSKTIYGFGSIWIKLQGMGGTLTGVTNVGDNITLDIPPSDTYRQMRSCTITADVPAVYFDQSKNQDTIIHIPMSQSTGEVVDPTTKPNYSIPQSALIEIGKNPEPEITVNYTGTKQPTVTDTPTPAVKKATKRRV